MSFEKAMIPLIVMLVGFIAAVSGKSDAEQAVLQTVVLTTMFSICAFGIYLSERLRRSDFLKTRLIARQNDKLNEMLADVRLDNLRKVAAMNLLVHFVKTPVHQIVGFTDIITRALEAGAGEASKDSLEGARFIKSASRELSQNVSRLLAYYRLDEGVAGPPSNLVELDSLIRDYAEHLPDGFKVRFDCDKVAIVSRQTIVNAALAALVDHYSTDSARGALEIQLRRSADGAELNAVDDGPLLSQEEFACLTKPLDKLDHYLTANGSSMPMALRTAARAAELCGGYLSWRSEGGRNRLTLALKDFAGAAQLEGAA